jgi:hypothetical protein
MFYGGARNPVCVCASVRARVRACVHGCVRAHASECMCVHAYACIRPYCARSVVRGAGQHMCLCAVWRAGGGTAARLNTSGPPVRRDAPSDLPAAAACQQLRRQTRGDAQGALLALCEAYAVVGDP